MSTMTEQETAASTGTRTGDFVWHELRTTDAKAAEDFYTHVVGWTAQGSGDPNGVPYTILASGGIGTAGLMQLTPEMQAGGMRPAWVGFIGVSDVDAYSQRLQDAGGKTHCALQDIPGLGRFASVEDPQGAAFLLFKGAPQREQRQPQAGAPGTVGWNELSANDEQTAWSFYSNLLGWREDSRMDMGPGGIYRIFNNGAQPIGAMMTRDRSKSPVPFWAFYFNVDSIDDAVARIGEKKGQVCMGPHEVPGGQWIVIGSDPQGAMFALVGPKSK